MNQLKQKLQGLKDYWVRARNVWCESRGQPWRGQIAVDWVVKNRMVDPRWPDDAKGVILQKNQFSWTRTDDPQYRMAFAPWRFDKLAWDEAKRVIEAIDNGAPDPTGGANHYFNMETCRRSRWGIPKWYDENKVTAHIGDHIFLKL